MRKTKKGFTLIELIIVIAVLAIIAVIAIPVVSGVIKNAEKTAAETNVRSIAAATKTAISLLEDTSGLKDRMSVPPARVGQNTGVYLEIEKSILNSVDAKLYGKYLVVIDFANTSSTERYNISVYYREKGYNAYEQGYIYKKGEITYGDLFFPPVTTP